MIVEVSSTIVNEATELAYTFSTPDVKSFNVSYFFSNQGDNNQFSSDETTLPIVVKGGIIKSLL